MAFKITWSKEAYKTFTQNIEYLELNWSEKEIQNFTKDLNKIIERIKKYLNRFLLHKKCAYQESKN